MGFLTHSQSLDRAYEIETARLNLWWEQQQIMFDRLKRRYEYEEWLEQEFTKGQPFTDEDLRGMQIL